MKNKEAQQPTLYKSNSGRSGKIKVCAFNKLWWWRKGNRLEIRYCSYTGPLPVMLKDDTTNRTRTEIGTDKMPTLRKIKRAAKPSTIRHNLQHI